MNKGKVSYNFANTHYLFFFSLSFLLLLFLGGGGGGGVYHPFAQFV